MVTSKRFFIIWLQIAVCVLIAFASCKNTSGDNKLNSPQTTFEQPVIQPLIFSKAKKINWDTVKAVKVHPVVKKLNWDKLPQKRYDTSDFKPFRYPVEETKFDYSALPSKDLDIDKLPSHPLKFKTYILLPPKLIKGAKLQFKNGNLFTFNFAEAQGKQGITVSDLLNDRDGFLWIATPRGVYRYDGENLLLFFSDPKMPLRIYGMVQDSDGNIWITAEDSTGGFSGIMVLNPKAGTLKKSGVGMGLKFKNAARLIKDNRQRIWVTSWGSSVINIIDPKKQTVKLLDEINGPATLYGTDAIAMDKNDNIWISTFRCGLNIIDLKNKKIKYLDKAHGLKTDASASICFDRIGRMWTGIDNGLINVVDIKKNTIQTIREAQSIPDHYVRPLSTDDKGRVWVGAGYSGLVIIDPEKRTFGHLKQSDGLASDFVLDINNNSKNRLWIAGNFGLNMLNDCGNTAVVEHIGRERISYLKEDREGFVWISTAHGADILDRKTKISRHLGLKDFGIIKEQNGTIFIKTNSSLDIIDSAKKTITLFGEKQGLKPNLLYDLGVDKAGRMWVGEWGANGGIDVYDPQKKTLKHIGEAQGINQFGLRNMCMDKNDRIWATLDKGEIDKIDPNAGTIQHLNNVLDLKYNAGKVWLPDSKGNIWIGTYKGIYIADLKNQMLISLTTAQGLINNKK